MDYLYHYTSLETLALILQNRTFRLNNLAAMDDLEEGSFIDLGKIGRFIYSSSWTKDAMESIPLWQLYTPDMSGVRIKMPENIFEEELISSEEITEYIVNNTDYSAEEVKAGAISFNKGLWEIQKRHNVYFPTFKANRVQ